MLILKKYAAGDVQVTVLQSISSWARKLKYEIIALYLAYRHPDTPLFAKGIAFAVVAYALSPIDLIPDFIPLLGYLDDIILLPLGIMLAIKLIPNDIMEQSRIAAQDKEKPISFQWMRWVVMLIWIIFLVLSLRIVFS